MEGWSRSVYHASQSTHLNADQFLSSHPQSQCGLAGFKGRSREVAEDLRRVSEQCLLKQDE